MSDCGSIADVTFEVTRSEPLRHNPSNSVTVSVDRVYDAAGTSRICKQLQRNPESTGRWAASSDRRHWNYWRREAAVYADVELRASLVGTGLDLPAADVIETDDTATLWLEDVRGTPGIDFDLPDHVAVATALGRWQATEPFDQPWASENFLRDYSGSQPTPAELVDDDAAWQQPLVADNWPRELRAGWRRLLDNRALLLDVMAGLPRTRCHLDVWVSNEIRRPTGEVVLLDWAFAGDGARGEDLGNHVPDATLDLFWPAERIAELDAACFDAYLAGLRSRGWRGSPTEVRLGVVASCVKYTWLLPGMLQRASAETHAAYHRPADAGHLYRQRGLTFAHLVAWCDEALAILGR